MEIKNIEKIKTSLKRGKDFIQQFVQDDGMIDLDEVYIELTSLNLYVIGEIARIQDKTPDEVYETFKFFVLKDMRAFRDKFKEFE